MNLRCGSCGSDELRAVKLVYEMGTSRVRLDGSHASSGGGGALGPGGFSAGAASAAGTVELEGEAISRLAQRCAPPRRREVSRNIGCLMLFAIPAVVMVPGLFYLRPPLGWIAAGVVILGLLGWISLWRDASRAKRWNAEVWPLLYREWAARWICMRCGEINNPPAAE